MSAQTIRFPKPMKRGAKVKHGPCATLLEFPAQLTGDALRMQWAWLLMNHGCWQVDSTAPDQRERLDGRGGPFDWRLVIAVSEGASLARGTPFTEARMRRDIAKFCAVVEKRVQIKDWLKRLGIDREKVSTEQDALSFLFDRLGGPELPKSA